MPDLYAHQRRGVDLLTTYPRYALWWDCGVGKTATVLDVISKLKLHRVLVLCPRSIIKPAWKDDAATFTPHLSIRGWHDKPRVEFWNATIQVVNYESFRARYDEFEPRRYDLLVVDESSRIKDPHSKTSRLVRDISLHVPRVVLLSGTPAPNDALEFWPQAFCIDPALLGGKYRQFRCEYGKSKRLYLGDRHVDLWVADPAKLPTLLSRLATKSDTLRKEDCLDLPAQVDETIEVTLSAPDRKAYNELERSLVLAYEGGAIVAETALSEIMKLRQLCNGWAYDDQRVAHEWGNSKLNVLLDTLRDLHERAVIWVEYRHDADRIAKELDGLAVTLMGGMTGADQCLALDQFTSGRRKYLVTHPQTAGHGLTLCAGVGCRYAVYYSLSYSWEQHKQSRDRIHRIGQQHKTTYLYLTTTGTIEPDIYQCVKGKKTAHDFALEFLRSRSGH